MAFHVFYSVLFWGFYYPFCIEAAQTRVEITSPVYPVTFGGILALQCQVWNMQDEYTVNLFRVVDGRTDPLSVRGKYDSDSTLGQRGFLAKRTFSDGSLILFLTVVDIVQSDGGKYSCKVYSWTDETINNVAQDSMIIEIYTFPSTKFPSCESDRNTLTLISGENVILTCTSEKAFPVVQLNWHCINLEITFSLRDATINEKTITSKLALTVDSSYNGAIFECKMTSAGFPDRERNCIIGPLKIVQDELDVGQSNKPGMNPVESNGIQNVGISKGEICNTPCPSEDKYTLLYWAVATVGTTILMFIFLTTTIMYCYKYFTISGEVVAAQGSFTSCDGSEPVYVSLQRRQPPERNSMFMSVEDPNNPGNKVLMPREVFDEFYRSLSLKKREPNY